MNYQDPAVRQLAQWWRDKAEDEIAGVIPKAIEYGSDDLEEMGRTLLNMMGHRCNRDCILPDEDPNATGGILQAHAQEVGIWFYTLGKMARWTAAVKAGKRVSTDTLLDMGVYSTMARRIRVNGSWPGVDLIPNTNPDDPDDKTHEDLP